jgi:hypothetical protein
MATATLNYTPLGGAATTLTLTVRRAIGFDTPDSFELFPGLQHKAIDGGVSGQTSAFRRLITLDVGVQVDPATQKGILYFLMDDLRTVDYGGESGIRVELVNPKNFKVEFLNGSKYGKKYALELQESIVRQSFPV